jgi:hypothetical protein
MAAATVAQQLVVEVDGRTEDLESKISALQKKIDNFASSGGPKGAGEAAEAMGDKFSLASRHIAGAGEAFARMGEVGGREMKEVLAQGGEIVSFFGPGGALIGALGIATLAVYEMYDRMEKKSEEARRKFGEDVEQMVKAKNLVGLSEKQQSLYSGEGAFAVRKEGESDATFKVRQKGVGDSKAEVQQLIAAFNDASAARDKALAEDPDALKQTTSVAIANVDKIDAKLKALQPAVTAAEAQYNALLPAVGAVTKKISEEAENNLKRLQEEAAPGYAAMVEQATKALAELGTSGAQALAGGTKSAVDNAVAALAQYKEKTREAIAAINAEINNPDASKRPNAATTAALQAAKSTIEQQAKTVTDQWGTVIDRLAQKEADGIRSTIGKALADVTGSLSENAGEIIHQQNADLRQLLDSSTKLSASEKERLRNQLALAESLQVEAATAKAATRDVASTIQAIDLAGPVAKSFDTLAEFEIQLTQTQSTMNKNGEGYRIIQAAILEIEKERKKLNGELVKVADDGATITRKTLQDVQDQARAIQQSVDGALQLAAAFGIVDQKTTSVLRSIGQAAANIPVLVTQLETLGQAGGGTAGGVASAALPILGAVATLVSSLYASNNEEDRQRAKVLEDNSAALRNLSETIKGVNVRPGAYDAAGQAIAMLEARARPTGSPYPFGEGGVKADLSSLTPLQIDKLNAAAKALGITLDGTEASFLYLQAAIKAAEPEIEAAYAEQQKEEQEDLHVRLLRAQGLVAAADAEEFAEKQARELQKAIDDGADADTRAALAATQAAEATQFFAEQAQAAAEAAEQAGQTDVSNTLAMFDIKDPAKVFKAKAQAYAKTIGGSLGDLLKSFNLDDTSAENIGISTPSCRNSSRSCTTALTASISPGCRSTTSSKRCSIFTLRPTTRRRRCRAPRMPSIRPTATSRITSMFTRPTRTARWRSDRRPTRSI